jgi:hypothetical protein
MELSGFEEIAALDLEPIKRKLMHGKSGQGWPEERANAAEREYRRFLFLMKQYPSELVAPLKEVDAFWHHHILDTAKYARDCQQVFGYFLHHYPYLGLLGKEDAARRAEAGSRMRALYQQTFGHTEDAMANDTRGGVAYCAVTSVVQRLVHDVAYCAVPNDANRSAYCAAASPTVSAQNENAYCAAGEPVELKSVREAALH